MFDPLRSDPRFQKLCQEKRPDPAQFFAQIVAATTESISPKSQLW